MSHQRSLRLLLLSLLCSSLLHAFSAGEEEDNQEVTDPLMMMMRSYGKQNHSEKSSEQYAAENDHTDKHLDSEGYTAIEEEKSDLGNETLRDVDNSNDVLLKSDKVMDVVANNDIRIDEITNEIAKQKSLYKKELASLNPTSDKAEIIKDVLLPLLKQAHVDQINIVKKLEQSNLPQCEISRLLLQINDRLNKIEGLEDKIKKYNQEVTQAQETYAAITYKIAVLWLRAGYFASASSSDGVPKRLSDGVPELLSDFVSQYLYNAASSNWNSRNQLKILESQIITFAKLSNLPYEDIDEGNQKAMAVNQREMNIASARVRIHNMEARRSLALYGDSLAPYGSLEHRYKWQRNFYFEREEHSLLEAAKEVKRPEPQEVIINYSVRAAEQYHEAAAALENIDDRNSVKRSNCLSKSGNYFDSAAQYACAEKPDQTYISSLVRKAENWKAKAAALL